MIPDKNKIRETQNIQLFPWFRDVSRKRAEKLIKEGNIEMMKYNFMWLLDVLDYGVRDIEI